MTIGHGQCSTVLSDWTGLEDKKLAEPPLVESKQDSKFQPIRESDPSNQWDEGTEQTSNQDVYSYGETYSPHIHDLPIEVCFLYF